MGTTASSSSHNNGGNNVIGTSSSDVMLRDRHRRHLDSEVDEEGFISNDEIDSVNNVHSRSGERANGGGSGRHTARPRSSSYPGQEFHHSASSSGREDEAEEVDQSGGSRSARGTGNPKHLSMASSATSSSRGSHTGSTNHCWLLIKAKTRQHQSTRVSRRIIWYEAKPGTSFSIGRSQSCDLRLEDDRCHSLNAIFSPTLHGDVAGVELIPKARTYTLVGMGGKKNHNESLIEVGAVIKVGSVSLEVTDMCLCESDDYLDRFAVEIDTAKGGKGKNGPAYNSKTSGNKDSGRGLQTGSESTEDNSKEEQGSGTEGSVEEGASQIDADERVAVMSNSDDQAIDEEDPDEAMCYICWGGLDASTTDDNNDGETGEGGGSKPSNPLIQNPCGKCSGSSKYVHLNCLLTWIKSSQSGHCSICNGPLPQHFSSPPPNLELKVVRHRRGQSWVGTRRFRLSFADRDFAIIGRDNEADVRLSDRSVGSIHARITFNRETRQFFISDCQSLGGTFLQVKERVDLVPEHPTYLKIGRTLLSLRLTQRKGMLLQSMWQSTLSSLTKR